MATDRLQTLLKFVEQNPDDAFVRYGLAQEYVSQGQLQSAVKEFSRLIESNPNYQAAYYHGGQTCLKMGRKQEAHDWFRRGIELAGRTGDNHARDELKAALEESS